jgi:hypothetical protein
MLKTIKMFLSSNKQTKYFVFTLVLYMVALIWTTIQAYARLDYSRTGTSQPILIQRNIDDQS